jgi:hypothetical protein
VAQPVNPKTAAPAAFFPVKKQFERDQNAASEKTASQQLRHYKFAGCGFSGTIDQIICYFRTRDIAK